MHDQIYKKNCTMWIYYDQMSIKGCGSPFLHTISKCFQQKDFRGPCSPIPQSFQDVFFSGLSGYVFFINLYFFFVNLYTCTPKFPAKNFVIVVYRLQHVFINFPYIPSHHLS